MGTVSLVLDHCSVCLMGYIHPCIDHLKHTMLHSNNTNMKSADRSLLLKVQIRQVVVE